MYFVFAALSIVGLACLAGIMMSIGFVLGPFWLSLAKQEFQPVFRSTGQLILLLLPYVLVPTVAGLIGVQWSCRTAPAMERSLWALALASLIITMVLTKFWFFPRNELLLSAEIQSAELTKGMQVWLRMHLIRIILPLVGSIAGLSCLISKR